MPLPSSRPEHSFSRGEDPSPGGPAGDSKLFGHQLIRPKRFVIPHPLVAVAGVAGIFAIYQLGQARGYTSMLEYAPWLIGFLLVFSYVSRRSARNESILKQRELEQLRKQPVWNLNDGDSEDDPPQGNSE